MKQFACIKSFHKVTARQVVVMGIVGCREKPAMERENLQEFHFITVDNALNYRSDAIQWNDL